MGIGFNLVIIYRSLTRGNLQNGKVIELPRFSHITSTTQNRPLS